jgi:hypothetical protein
MPEKKTYLGDGVYYELRDGRVVLTTENGLSATNVIFLEPEVVAKFLERLGNDFSRDKLCAIILGQPE